MEIYLFSGCSSCRQADSVLARSGKPYERRDFFKDRFSVEELRALLDRAGVGVGEVLSTRSRVYRELGLGEKQLTESGLLELMVREPTLLRRPLILGGRKTVIGFNAAAIDALIESA